MEKEIYIDSNIFIFAVINNNLKVIVSEDKDFDRIKEVRRTSMYNLLK